MSNYNKVFLIGRVTRDPELRYTPNGQPVAKFGLAVNRNRPKGGGDPEVDFFDITAWQQTAEFAAKYATKGKLVFVDGRLQVRNYETQDGQKRKAWEIVVNDLRLLSSRDSNGSGGGGNYGGDESFETATRPTYQAAPAPRDPDPGPQNMGLDDIPF